MDNTKVTFLNKKYEEYLPMINNPTSSEELAPDNVNMDNENKEYNKGNINNNNNNIETVNNDSLQTDNNSFNKDLIKHEIHESLSIIDSVINNNSYEKDSVIQNDKSYVKEFELYLKNYREKYDSYSACTNVGDIPSTSETEEFINDVYKYVDFEQMLDLNNSYVNSENVLPGPGQNNSESNNFNRNIYIKDICNSSNVENITASGVDIAKSFNFKTEINNDDEHKHKYTHDIVDDFNSDVKNTDAFIEENNIILIGPESSELLLDTNVENTTASGGDNVKSFNPETELNCHNEANKYNYTNAVQDSNDDTKMLDAVIEEDNIILISSESSSTIDEIHLDPSENYSILNNIKIDSIDEFKLDPDSEGYNSSDFEFIDEEQACLNGVINRSESNIELRLIHNNLNVVEDRGNNEPGPNRIGYSLDIDTVSRLNSRNNSDLEVEQLNHVIPAGEQFYELFAEPWAMFDFQAENKAFFSNKAMHLEADDIGFNVEMLHRRHEENEMDDAIKEEAIDSARKIVTMYPIENMKRRRPRL